MGEQTKGVGIAVETCHVEPFGLGKAFAVGGDELMQACSAPLAEVGAYGPLARVAKGRIAHVVGQTGGTDDGPHAGDLGVGQCGVAGYELAADIGAKRTAHARHLEAVGEAVVYEHAAGERKHLCLVLHAAEGGRKYKTVVVALELGAALLEGLGLSLLAKAF